MECYVGLEVALKQTSICVVSGTGSVVREGVVNSDPDAIAAFVTATGKFAPKWTFLGRHGCRQIAFFAARSLTQFNSTDDGAPVQFKKYLRSLNRLPSPVNETKKYRLRMGPSQ
jgi:hypothetical protein